MQSICPKCRGSFFEIIELDVMRFNFRLRSVQCTSCGAVVGVMEYSNIGEKLNEVIDKLDEILERLDRLEK